MSDSKRVDVSKTHKGLLALLMIRNQDPKSPNATRYAAAEMAIDKCAAHCRRADKPSEYNECVLRCSEDFKSAFFIVNRAVMERQALNEEVERDRNKIDRSHAGMRR